MGHPRELDQRHPSIITCTPFNQWQARRLRVHGNRLPLTRGLNVSCNVATLCGDACRSQSRCCPALRGRTLASSAPGEHLIVMIVVWAYSRPGVCGTTEARGDAQNRPVTKAPVPAIDQSTECSSHAGARSSRRTLVTSCSLLRPPRQVCSGTGSSVRRCGLCRGCACLSGMSNECAECAARMC